MTTTLTIVIKWGDYDNKSDEDNGYDDVDDNIMKQLLSWKDHREELGCNWLRISESFNKTFYKLSRREISARISIYRSFCSGSPFVVSPVQVFPVCNQLMEGWSWKGSANAWRSFLPQSELTTLISSPVNVASLPCCMSRCEAPVRTCSLR